MDPFDFQSLALTLPKRYQAPEPLARLIQQESQPLTAEELHCKNRSMAMRSRRLEHRCDAGKPNPELTAPAQGGGPRRG